MPFEVLYAAAEPYSLAYAFTAIIDGDFIPDFTSRLLQSGRFDKGITGLVGANLVRSSSFDRVITKMHSQDEGASPAFSWKGINTDGDFYTLLTSDSISSILSFSSANYYPNCRLDSQWAQYQHRHRDPAARVLPEQPKSGVAARYRRRRRQLHRVR